MPKRRQERPPLTVNRGFLTALLDAEPPVFALGLVEIKGQKRGFLALHPAEAIPAESTAIGVSFGHGLLGRTPRECVIQFSFHFYGPRALDPAGDPLQMTCPEPPPRKRRQSSFETAPFETPVSPANSLRLLNDTMRTDLLRFVHDGIAMGKALASGESPLQMLIRSITAIRKVCTDTSLLAAIGPNPFNRESRSRPFDPEADARHDLRLLDFHLQAPRGLQANQAAQTGNWQTAALPEEPAPFSAVPSGRTTRRSRRRWPSPTSGGASARSAPTLSLSPDGLRARRD